MASSPGLVNTCAQAARDKACRPHAVGHGCATRPARPAGAIAPMPAEGPAPAPHLAHPGADRHAQHRRARLQPSSTKVMARPRCSGGTITPSAAAACGVNTAADSTEMARTGSSAAYLGISAATAVPHTEPQQRARQQPAPVEAGHQSSQCWRPDRHHDGGHRNQLPGHRHADLQGAGQVVERAGGHHHAAPDGEVAGQQRPARGRHAAPGSPDHLQRLGVDDVGGAAVDEADHVVEGLAEVQLVAVLLHIADVRRADRVFQPQQRVTLQDGLGSKTSTAARPGRPLFSAETRALSATSSAREVLTNSAVGFMRERSPA
jgi:hypothetical protein